MQSSHQRLPKPMRDQRSQPLPKYPQVKKSSISPRYPSKKTVFFTEVLVTNVAREIPTQAQKFDPEISFPGQSTSQELLATTARAWGASAEWM